MKDERALLAGARALGGRTIGEVAAELSIAVPTENRRAKGLAGTVVERALGFGGSHAGPDVPHLGVELKTLPIDARGAPLESTYVCMAPHEPEPSWELSRVRAKLARVLFIPVTRATSPGARIIGSAFYWSPSEDEDAMLRADWSELTDLLARDEADFVGARRGRALQLRPKGRNAADRVRSFSAEGAPRVAPRRGFYLRRLFTARVLRAAGLLAPGGA